MILHLGSIYILLLLDLMISWDLIWGLDSHFFFFFFQRLDFFLKGGVFFGKVLDNVHVRWCHGNVPELDRYGSDRLNLISVA